jgi:NitT/TauT family transport system substrate-binding protein
MRVIELMLGMVALLLFSACHSEKPVEEENSNAASAVPQTEITLQLNWFPEAEHGGYFHGLVSGMYSDAGLDIRILSGGPNTPVETQVVLGEADFGIVNADKILAVRQNDVNIVGLLAPYQKSPRCVIVKANSSIKSFADVQDVTFITNTTKPFFKFLKKKYEFRGVKTIPYRGGPATFMANEDCIIQGYVNSEPFVFEKNGVKTRQLMLYDEGFNPYTSVLVCSESLLKEKPELVKRMVKASQAAWKAYLKDPRKANAEISKRNPEMDAVILEKSSGALSQLMLTDEGATRFGMMVDHRWNALAASLHDIGVLKTKATDDEVNAAYTTQFIVE